MAQRVIYESVPVGGPHMEALLGELREIYVNGGAVAARFRRMSGPDDSAWFAASTGLSLNQAFQDLLDSEVARSALPELRLPRPWPVANPPAFFRRSPGTLTFDGELAHRLVTGGPYARFERPQREAKELAGNAVEELIGNRHEDVAVYVSETAWTPWFCGVAWDYTWVLVNDARGEVTVLCLTDTD